MNRKARYHISPSISCLEFSPSPFPTDAFFKRGRQDFKTNFTANINCAFFIKKKGLRRARIVRSVIDHVSLYLARDYERPMRTKKCFIFQEIYSSAKFSSSSSMLERMENWKYEIEVWKLTLESRREPIVPLPARQKSFSHLA